MSSVLRLGECDSRIPWTLRLSQGYLAKDSRNFANFPVTITWNIISDQVSPSLKHKKPTKQQQVQILILQKRICAQH